MLVQRYELYSGKDLHLQSVGKQKRYNPDNPEQFFYNLAKVKSLVSSGYLLKHKKEFHSENRQAALKKLANRRNKNNEVRAEKIRVNNKLYQNVEPLYVDIFIAAYHERGVTTKDKIEVFNELKKFNCKKSIQFFQRLNDSERNNQIRRLAFEHLQSIGVFVKLRKNFKGKRKSYTVERDCFNVTPKDLVERIESDLIQSQKVYDVFISHSNLDSELVMELKDSLNLHDFSIYCDWTSDNDFLKRNLAGKYTEQVLKKRIEQSKTLLFLKTENSMNKDGCIRSEWVDMEISYAKELAKPVYCINLNGGPCPYKLIQHEIVNEVLWNPSDTGNK